MDYKPLLPPPLMAAGHIAPLDKLIRAYLNGDNDVILTNEAKWYYATVLNFDTVPAEMLPYLAKMFGVDGFKGFDYAPTEALKRETLKNAMLRYARHGTRWALRVALENAGFQHVVINDHLQPINYWDGSHNWDGSINWFSEHWAHFTIEMEPPVGVAPNQVDIPALMRLINFWKRACTLCTRVTIAQLVITSFGIGDDVNVLWDAAFDWDGSVNYQ